MALAALAASPAAAQDPVKIGFITKFPVPFFASMEDAAKAYTAANSRVEITFGGLKIEIAGQSATNCTEELGISVAEDLLTKTPELKAI